ncbi:GSK3B-interacting protein-like [Oppia nitens]|uniref:GSK3B-interacting protein-like n=1 Tax=Oppia nitens TaxID=1686743 RepID=UPI0023DB95DC|nr:GSK3B-interacting protein-like [Oppia nitens]
MSKSPISDERLLNSSGNDGQNGWKYEALAVIQDIHSFVKQLTISSELPCDENGVYLNLETKEETILTIEMSSAGFRICGHQLDTNDLTADDRTVYYETPYALLDNISPKYRQSFGDQLAQKLQEFSDKQMIND